jgi:hypothetical protein
MSVSVPPVSQKAVAHALCARMQRFLAALERARRQPNRRETFYLREALYWIELGDLAQAEASIGKAQLGTQLPASVASMLETNVPATIEELREQIRQAMARES